MQTRIPRLSDAQVGLGMPQSAQNLLPGLSKLGCEPFELNDRVESTDRTSVPTRLKNESSKRFINFYLCLNICSIASTQESRSSIESHEKFHWSPVDETTVKSNEFSPFEFGCPDLPGTFTRIIDTLIIEKKL